MKMKKKVIPFVLVAGLSMSTLTGCVKPFDKPEYVEVKPNQTAFVIPLEGKTSDQGKFESEEFLKNAQVATKRIQIPHKEIKKGRFYWQVKFVDTVRVIVVDRYPETREWKGENAFIGESKDSIKFQQGLSATAQILEEDASTFLYQYSGKSLKQVMDSEIRNKIGSVLLEKYGTQNIDDIRGAKGDVIEYVRKEVEPYFKQRGITLSNIGYIGDLQYLQADIQEAINKDFKAQQEKKAQATINKKNEEQAQSELVQAQRKAQAMKTLAEMKELEIQDTIAKGLANGTLKLPETLVIGEGGNMLFDIPVQSKEDVKK
jgi:hypothetical protein